MPPTDKSKRFQNLFKVPAFAAADHRFFLDKNGQDSRLAALSRKQRRKIEADAKRIGAAYQRTIQSFLRSGAGYPVDQLIRQLALEYTNRYASSGLHTQPVNFNYFEPFCDIKLIDESFAPYAQPATELDHLFSIVDYFDYITSPEGCSFNLSQLDALPDSKSFHFTPSGNASDFTFLTAEGREFVVAGFSMIRRGKFLHWYVVGGEVFSEKEWQELSDEQWEIEKEDIPPSKRPFLSSAMEKTGNRSGRPVALEGTERALRTIIVGETDLTSRKHLGRCYMTEREHSFPLVCDDPGIFVELKDASQRDDMIQSMRDQIERAAVMWNLAEAMFQLPAYFAFKLGVAKSVAVSGGERLVKVPKGGRGVNAQFRYVSAIEYIASPEVVVRPYTGPHYQVETEGYWRRLSYDKYGHDADGNPIRGKTWIKATNNWRQRPDHSKTIYVKSSVAAAKIKLNEYLAKANATTEGMGEMPHDAGNTSRELGVLYVLRCTVMKDEVYKVGWTSGTAEHRAQELSSATGVPSSFVVVSSWKHPDAEALESGVHAMLASYRISEGREFFQVNFAILKSIVEREIERTAKPSA